MTQHTWGQARVSLPHCSCDQFNQRQRVKRSDDLMYYTIDTSNVAAIQHVATYMGNDHVIEAQHPGGGVQILPVRWVDYIGATPPGT